MFSRYRYPLLAVLTLALLGAAPLAHARDRHHVDFSLILPPLVVSSHHGQGTYAGYYNPHSVEHYHGRQICHLRHEYRHEYGHDHHYDRHRHYRDHYYRH